MTKQKLDRDENGKLPAAVFPGGYSIRYFMGDGAVICAPCANGENGSYASEDEEDDEQWRIEAAFVQWEGPTEYCEHCNGDLPSEYGDPDEEN